MQAPLLERSQRALGNDPSGRVFLWSGDVWKPKGLPCALRGLANPRPPGHQFCKMAAGFNTNRRATAMSQSLTRRHGLLPVRVRRDPSQYHPNLDTSIFWFEDCFDAAAVGYSMHETDGDHRFQRMRECIAAISLLPSSTPEAIAVKRRLAQWWHEEGNFTMTLTENDRERLILSADRDERRMMS